MRAANSYDYIIVGAGSAGCVLAARLSEDPSVSVLLLEAGGADWNPLIHIPLGIGKLYEHELYDWRYRSEPERQLNNRRITSPRGKVLGGSSSINVMTYARGDCQDYDRWQRNGADGWSYSQVLPYFKRTEAAEEGESDTRGGAGPVGVQWTRARDPISLAWIEAATQLGFPKNADPARGATEGIGLSQYTIKNGRRSSAATAYLHPARCRANLTVLKRVLVTRILIEKSRAIGVSCIDRSGKVTKLFANREVILSAGVFNSPQLLMLSGIGPADHLCSHSIDVVADLPVGRNLQDHLMTVIMYARKCPGEFHGNMRLDRLAINMMRSYLTGTGYASSLPGGVIAFLKTDLAIDAPDMQFMFPTAPFHARMWFPFFKPAYDDAFLVRPAILHPESRGEVKLGSVDPRIPVLINFNFLSAQNDLLKLRKAFRIGREIARQKPLDPFRGREMSPGEDVQTDADVDAFLRKSLVTISHPAGTCPMGVGPNAVLDSALNVYGISGLRVVDASAMPDLVSAPINACVLMMAERASDMIRGRLVI